MSKIKGSNRNHTHLYFGVYAIFFKESDCGEIAYGRSTYDYQEGTLVFIAPGLVVEITRKEPRRATKGLGFIISSRFNSWNIIGTGH